MSVRERASEPGNKEDSGARNSVSQRAALIAHGLGWNSDSLGEAITSSCYGS